MLAVKKTVFGATNITAEFFDSFRQDYGGDAFDRWFARKADETVYVCHEGNDLVAFLYLKVEGTDENYSDIEPRFSPKRRLKIGTFKFEMNGFKLGERFLKIIFDNALRQNAEEIYVTIFPNTAGQQRLVKLLQDFGFVEHGTKTGASGNLQGRDLIEHCGNQEFDSLLGSLKRLRDKSIGQTIKSLLEQTLAGTPEAERIPVFKRAYDVRSCLVHDGEASHSETANAISTLNVLVPAVLNRLLMRVADPGLLDRLRTEAQVID